MMAGIPTILPRELLCRPDTEKQEEQVDQFTGARVVLSADVD